MSADIRSNLQGFEIVNAPLPWGVCPRKAADVAASNCRRVDAVSRVKTEQGALHQMAESDPPGDRLCSRLQQQIMLSILIDDLFAASLAGGVAAMRETLCLEVDELERALRTHRVAVLKQTAILGAAGIRA